MYAMQCNAMQCNVMYTLFFFIRTSNFDAEAERSYIFLAIWGWNVLKDVLKFTWQAGWEQSHRNSTRMAGLLVPLSTIMQS